MKKLENIRNLLLIAGMICCFLAFRTDPIEVIAISIGCALMVFGLISEVARTMIIWRA